MSGQNPGRELEQVLAAWPPAQAGLKRALVTLKTWAEALPGAILSFVARPGISHSLRFDLQPRPGDRQRQVFFLVDVVNSGGELFLSVCFYEDEISDPEERGNAIPQGLFRETGYCFDVDDYDDDQMAYLKYRLAEAHQSASR